MPDVTNHKVRNLTQLTTPGFVLYSPISVLAFPVSLLVVNPKASSIQLLFLGFLLTVITYCFYFPLMKLFSLPMELRLTTRILLFTLVISSTGAFRGFIFFYLGESFDLVQPSSLTKRVLASMFTTIFWLVTSNLIINISRTFRNQYQSTLNQYLAAQITDASTDIKLMPEYVEFQDLHKNLTESLLSLFESSSPESLGRESEKLTLRINEELRPLSRRIWLRSLGEYPVINYKILLRDSFKALNFSRRLFLGTMISLALLNNLFLRTPTESIWRTSTYLLSTLIILALSKKINALGNDSRVNFVFVLSISVIPIFLSEYLAGITGFDQNYLATLLITPVPIAVIVVLSLLDLSQKDRRFLLELLEAKSNNVYRETAAGLDPQKRQFASFLHNSFQSELLALSKQLSIAALSRDKNKTASVLQRVSAVASRSLSEDLSRMNQDPLERLGAVIKSWENMLDIDIKIDDEILEQSLSTAIFIQTLEEISSNSFRHDKATKLQITATPGEVGTKVFFLSNGAEPISKSKGMGSSWLDQVSLTPWSIEKTNSGTLITVEL